MWWQSFQIRRLCISPQALRPLRVGFHSHRLKCQFESPHRPAAPSPPGPGSRASGKPESPAPVKAPGVRCTVLAAPGRARRGQGIWTSSPWCPAGSVCRVGGSCSTQVVCPPGSSVDGVSAHPGLAESVEACLPCVRMLGRVCLVSLTQLLP